MVLVNDFYQFVDGSYLVTLFTKWQDTLVIRQLPKAIDIFVAGADKKLIFLKQIQEKDMFDFIRPSARFKQD